METCGNCGKELTYSGRGRPPSKYCSRSCKDAGRQRQRRAAAVEATGERRCLNCQGIIPEHVTLKAKCCSRDCGIAWNNRKRAEEKRIRTLAAREPCRGCGGPIPEEARAGTAYCSTACKRRSKSAAWRARSPHYMRQYLYGVTPGQYQAMLTKQGDRCAICRADDWPGKGRRPHTDHDHLTGRFRGILCGRCNNGLGMFGEDAARLRAAADYLERATA
jgi:hypothetical protein